LNIKKKHSVFETTKRNTALLSITTTDPQAYGQHLFQVTNLSAEFRDRRAI